MAQDTQETWSFSGADTQGWGREVPKVQWTAVFAQLNPTLNVYLWREPWVISSSADSHLLRWSMITPSSRWVPPALLWNSADLTHPLFSSRVTAKPTHLQNRHMYSMVFGLVLHEALGSTSDTSGTTAWKEHYPFMNKADAPTDVFSREQRKGESFISVQCLVETRLISQLVLCWKSCLLFSVIDPEQSH